ncbi:MAG: hypothetical protein Fur002_24150 [Anaerolineales bacterium]
MSHRNPFVYGRAVSGEECIPRGDQLQTVFNRLRNGESTAVIGEPHIGKTSFLLQLTDKTIQQDYLDDDDRRMFFASMDLHALGDEETPQTFWRETLAPLAKLRLPGVQSALERAARNQYNRQTLEALFSELAARNCLLVLLLDEFERLLKHPQFKDPGFFGLLRSLSTRTGGLALVLASRLHVRELNELGRGLLDTGSPFFNHTVDILLPPFTDEEIERLLERAEPPFSEEERLFIRRAAGRNPYLLQAMAGALYETPSSPARCEKAAETFYRRAALTYFDDLWVWMDDETRAIAVILAMQELGGRALGSHFNYGEIERVDRYGPELQKLAERGLAELLETKRRGWIWDGKNLLVWRGQRWGLGCAAFSWWVRDVAAASARSIPAYDEWLRQKKYIGFLTQKQWDDAGRLLQKIPASMLSGVGALAKSLWNEINTRQAQ